MRASFLENLLHIDLLTLYGSSRLASELCFLSQSNVYRNAMSLSNSLQLGLTKDKAKYHCRSNQDVLARLREASRMLRCRGASSLRTLSDYRSPFFSKSRAKWHWPLPQTWLGIVPSLQALDAGILDLLILRSSELCPLLGLRSENLIVGNWHHTKRYALLPLNTESVQLYAAENHPALRYSDLTPEQVAAYPSPAFSDALFPGLRQRLAPHGLWTKQLHNRTMSPALWEKLALGSGMVVQSTPNSISAASRTEPGTLLPLDYKTGLTDHDILAVPVHLIDEPAVKQAISDISSTYNLALPRQRSAPGISHSLLTPELTHSRS